MAVSERQQARADRRAMQAASSTAQKEQIAASISARNTPETTGYGRQVMASVANGPSYEPHADGVPISEMAAPLREKHAREAAALRGFQSKEEVMRAAEILRKNEGVWDEERLANGWARVNEYVATNPEEFKKAPTPEETAARHDALVAQHEQWAKEATQQATSKSAFVGDYFRQLTGLGSVAATVVNSAVAEPIVGILGVGALASNWWNNEDKDVVAAMDGYRDSMTLAPLTQEGEAMLQTIAAPIAKLDEGVRDISHVVGMENEWAATGIYTTLMAIPELAGLKGGSILKATRSAKIGDIASGKATKIFDKPLTQAKEIADRLGIEPVNQTMPSDILKAAGEMSSDVRAQNMGELQKAMISRKRSAEKRLEKLQASAMEKKAMVNTREVEKFADGFNSRMRQNGYDLDEMPTVATAIDRLRGLGKLEGPDGDIQVSSRRVQDWLMVRNQVEKAVDARKSNPAIAKEVNEKVVLQSLLKDLDDNLTHQLNSDMIKGSPDAIKAWQKVQKDRGALNEKFNANKIVRDMIDQDVSPEQLHRWVLGMQAASASPKMLETMTAIKKVLGKNHKAIRGVQSDFMYDVMAPMFKSSGPDLDGMIKNVDHILKNRTDVVKALDLSVDDLRAMKNFAMVSKKFPPSKTVKLVKDWAQLLARVSPFAHSISKAGAKVSLLSNVFRKMGGTHPAAQRQILAELAEAQFGGPVFDRGSVAAGRIIQSAFLADFTEIKESIDDEDVEPKQ